MESLRIAYGHHHWVGLDEVYDVLVVNGEGTLHHNAPGYFTKMDQLRAAVDAGKPAHLLNTVWPENDASYDDLLPQLTTVQVRDALSAIDMQKHGTTPGVVPDICWHAPVDESVDYPNFTGQVVTTDFYVPARGWLVPEYLADLPLIDMAKLSWSQTVMAMRSADLVLTGRHHGMFAACKASVPFIATRSNTHKIEGTVQSAGASITVLEAVPTLNEAVAQAEREAAEYRVLFDWLGNQPPRFPDLG